MWKTSLPGDDFSFLNHFEFSWMDWNEYWNIGRHCTDATSQTLSILSKNASNEIVNFTCFEGKQHFPSLYGQFTISAISQCYKIENIRRARWIRWEVSTSKRFFMASIRTSSIQSVQTRSCHGEFHTFIEQKFLRLKWPKLLTSSPTLSTVYSPKILNTLKLIKFYHNYWSFSAIIIIAINSLLHFELFLIIIFITKVKLFKKYFCFQKLFTNTLEIIK